MLFSSAANLPTDRGLFQACAVRDEKGVEHIIVYKGDLDEASDLPVRVHSECLTSEVFGSLRCDCDHQLATALDHLEAEGRGLIIYLRQEGRGIGLFNKVEAYRLQDEGLDTVEANEQLGFSSDSRSYQLAVDILKALRVQSVQLMTNNPKKLQALRRSGIEVTRRIPIRIAPNIHNSGYLETKQSKMAHMLSSDLPSAQIRRIVGCKGAAVGKEVLDRVQAVLKSRCSDPSRPSVTLAYAQSFDGCISEGLGISTAISSRQSQILTHELRAMHDALLVGVNTVIVDDPRLNVRLVAGPSPIPVIVDSSLRMPPDVRLLKQVRPHPLVVATRGACEEKRAALAELGAEVLCVDADADGCVDLESLLVMLRQRGIRSLMVEGGAKIITSVLTADLADQLVLTISPQFLGGVRSVESLGGRGRDRRPELKDASCHRIGGDLIVHGEFLRSAHARR
jgi:GTP cyclohydrolase II